MARFRQVERYTTSLQGDEEDGDARVLHCKKSEVSTQPVQMSSLVDSLKCLIVLSLASGVMFPSSRQMLKPALDRRNAMRSRKLTN
jgi:hypothetical protein